MAIHSERTIYLCETAVNHETPRSYRTPDSISEIIRVQSVSGESWRLGQEGVYEDLPLNRSESDPMSPGSHLSEELGAVRREHASSGSYPGGHFKNKDLGAKNCTLNCTLNSGPNT